jgi:DnaJ-class molecular chaperone
MMYRCTACFGKGWMWWVRKPMQQTPEESRTCHVCSGKGEMPRKES